MRFRLLSCLLALSLPLTMAISARAQEESQAGPDGAALYMQNCSTCHGVNLEGGNAQSMVNGIWQFGATPGYIFRNIKHGITHLGMPAYEATLEDDQIRAIVEFILAAEEEAGAERPPVPEQVQTLDYEIKVEVLPGEIEIPWDIAWMDAETALVTERPGGVRVIRDGELLPDPIANTPEVLHEGQGGMMAVAVDPDFADNGWVYLGYTHALPEGDGPRPPAMTRIVRGRIQDHAWTDEEVVYEAPHESYLPTRIHYGVRIVFDEDGYLYFGIGERGIQDHAQDLGRPNGKVHRIHRDGSIPEDNPFVDEEGALPSIYSYGNRNPQGLSFHPETGLLWESEHGPMGGDELNVIRAGRNYGWPEVSYGRNYSGTQVTEYRRKPGMEEPAWHWTPSTAVCGIAFYQGAEFPLWENQLLVSALRNEQVGLMTIVDDRVIHEELILNNVGRVRQAAPSPSGAIYVLTNTPDQILRLTLIRERSY